jgi:dTDP-4-amino-4,6-dideoxygalactose transaminase
MSKCAQQAIGGYFGLELPMGRTFHAGAVELNSGRNALRYILRNKPPTKIYIPQFTCAAILAAVINCGVPVDYYHIDESMEPIFDFNRIKETEAFLYTNYFGLKNQYIQSLSETPCRFIIDNAQSFFSTQVGEFETFYSPRKFFGVPDGGYVLGSPAANLARDFSSQRTHHLMIRHDDSAQEGYKYYLSNEKTISQLPLRAMSSLSARILLSIDYESVEVVRKRNFELLHRDLGSSNLLHIEKDRERVAHTYPYLSANTGLRESLLRAKVFTARDWPEIVQSASCSSIERYYAGKIVHLPIDQRYERKDMDRIIKSILL